MGDSKVKRSVAEYWQGSKAYRLISTREKMGKNVFTSQDHAEHRAKVCESCPFNLPATNLNKAADAIMLRQAGGRTTPSDSKLSNCDACSCPLKLTVHLDREVLLQTKDRTLLKRRIQKRQRQTGKRISPACWQLKIFNLQP